MAKSKRQFLEQEFKFLRQEFRLTNLDLFKVKISGVIMFQYLV